MKNRIRTWLGVTTTLVIAMVSVFHAIEYCYYVRADHIAQIPFSVELPYTYESDFPQGRLGVLDTSYFIVDPQSISGRHRIESGMLKIVSHNRYQVGFGMIWKPTFEPWLPLYERVHIEVTFVKPRGFGEVSQLSVENWIAWETGQSLTAMVWYQYGNLFYSYGAFPYDGGHAVLLDRFALPNEFTVTIDADYKAKNMTIDWNNHKYDVSLQIERVGTVPKPFTHFQITLMEPGTVYIRNLKVVLS